MGLEKKLERKYQTVYEDHQKYFLIPVFLVILSGLALGLSFASNGEFVKKGTDFSGGIQAQFEINGSFDAVEFEKAFSEDGKPGVDAQKTASGNLLLLIPIDDIDERDDIDESEVLDVIESNGYEASVLQFNSVSASVGSQFFLQAQIAFVLAFTVMSLVIFTAFKDITPSIAVIFAAAGDILVAAAGMSILGIPLTLGSLAALLMLIGYSVDTDIVLSGRTLRRERGSLRERMWESLKTGVTMSSGGILGFTILYFVSVLVVGPSELANISAVMVIGLLADMPLTWLGNTAILKSYIEDEKLFYRGLN